jgi:hypothetical protein
MQPPMPHTAAYAKRYCSSTCWCSCRAGSNNAWDLRQTKHKQQIHEQVGHWGSAQRGEKVAYLQQHPSGALHCCHVQRKANDGRLQAQVSLYCELNEYVRGVSNELAT